MGSGYRVEEIGHKEHKDHKEDFVIGEVSPYPSCAALIQNSTRSSRSTRQKTLCSLCSLWLKITPFLGQTGRGEKSEK